DAPAEPIELLYDVGIRLRRHRVHAAEGAAFAPRPGIRLAHPAALESSVDRELHAADAQPLAAFVRLDAGGGNRGAHRRRGVGAETQQLTDSDGELAARLHRLQQPV